MKYKPNTKSTQITKYKPNTKLQEFSTCNLLDLTSSLHSRLNVGCKIPAIIWSDKDVRRRTRCRGQPLAFLKGEGKKIEGTTIFFNIWDIMSFSRLKTQDYSFVLIQAMKLYHFFPLSICELNTRCFIWTKILSVYFVRMKTS